MENKKVHVKKGDQVAVLSGKDKGKKGKVLSVLPANGKVKVEGVGIVKKHAKPTQRAPQGGIQEQEAYIDASNVLVVCQSCKKAARTSKKILKDGTKARICKKCGEAVEK